jgi:CRISPR/Cas system endoribonuclease Cas6 (RAMP superfamily)
MIMQCFVINNIFSLVFSTPQNIFAYPRVYPTSFETSALEVLITPTNIFVFHFLDIKYLFMHRFYLR